MQEANLSSKYQDNWVYWRASGSAKNTSPWYWLFSRSIAVPVVAKSRQDLTGPKLLRPVHCS